MMFRLFGLGRWVVAVWRRPIFFVFLCLLPLHPNRQNGGQKKTDSATNQNQVSCNSHNSKSFKKGFGSEQQKDIAKFGNSPSIESGEGQNATPPASPPSPRPLLSHPGVFPTLTKLFVTECFVNAQQI